MFKGDYLYIENFAPDRWPGGNPETGYLNTDGGPTKSLILNLRRTGKNTKYWQMCFGKGPAEELYYLETDPDCINNLANILLITGETNEAFYMFESMLEKVPKNVEKRMKVADIYAEVGDWSKVEYHLQQCLKVKEKRMKVADIYAEVGDWSKVEYHLQQCQVSVQGAHQLSAEQSGEGKHGR